MSQLEWTLDRLSYQGHYLEAVGMSQLEWTLDRLSFQGHYLGSRYVTAEVDTRPTELPGTLSGDSRYVTVGVDTRQTELPGQRWGQLLWKVIN